MAQRGLRALQPKNYVPKTSDGRADKPSPNLLSGQPLPAAPDRVWAGDITFIPTSAGLALPGRRHRPLLAPHRRLEPGRPPALRSRRRRPPASPADAAPSTRTIFHSDRGSQYGSTLFRQALAKAGLRQSMSARANPYDNAWTESFIGTLKHEMLQGGCFENAADARTEIFEYIEGYYNTHRKHSSLGYQTPSQFEAQIHSTQLNHKTVQKSVAPHRNRRTPAKDKQPRQLRPPSVRDVPSAECCCFALTTSEFERQRH